MEIIAAAIEALGSAAVAWATAYGFIYCIGIGTKTFLIYIDKIKAEECKDWFDFKIWKNGGNRL